MASEVFNLKSIYLEDTVARGVRVGLRNAPTTNTIIVNGSGEQGVKTGETGLSADYLIQSSLSANDLKSYGIFTEGSAVVRGYTGSQDVSYSDRIRLDTDYQFYTVTGMQGNNIYLTTDYKKENEEDPDVQEGPSTVRKIQLDSVKYEYIKSHNDENIISYDDEKSTWAYTGIQPEGPEIAPTEKFEFDPNLDIQFQKSSISSAADLMTVNTTYKTLVDGNTTEIFDLSVSPIPYPHESLRVYWGKLGEEPELKEEFVDYVINYSQDPTLKFPYPPYEERKVAFIKFLGELDNEIQVEAVGTDFDGQIALISKDKEDVERPVQNITPGSDSITVGGKEKSNNQDYLLNEVTGQVNFIKHQNEENLVNVIAYPKRLIWDGISLIKGVKEDEVIDIDNLVVPPVEGVYDIDYPVYFEDTDSNNLIRDIDYILETESGALAFSKSPKSTDVFLASYYVEGDDVVDETIYPQVLRTKQYPILEESVSILKKYEIETEGEIFTDSRVLIEGTDFTISYLTGKLVLNESSEESTISLQVSYTPLASINCVLRPTSGNALIYRMKIIDDILTVTDGKSLVFTVNNPRVSIPKENPFLKNGDDGKYTFDGTIIDGTLSNVYVRERPEEKYITDGYTYTDVIREVLLDDDVNENRVDSEDTVLATYDFQSEGLPYAPVVVTYLRIEDGASSFKIEGFDRTDVLKKESVLRIDNFDPEETYYYRIKDATYLNGDTYISIYGEFDNAVFNPNFYLLDDSIEWSSLPEGSLVDKEALEGSEAILLYTNDVNGIINKIRVNTLLQADMQDIYSVTSVAIAGENAVVLGIFPTLNKQIQDTIEYTPYPVAEEGTTVLNASYPILLDPEEPAFSVAYKSPTGFEGEGKILVLPDRIQLYESISGVQNPEPYEVLFSGYTTVKGLSDAIKEIKSTYNDNITVVEGVPEYKPFSTTYVLPGGDWSADLIIPFEVSDQVDLPYTLTVSPELFKWSILKMEKDASYFDVENYDATDKFKENTLVAFADKDYNTVYYHEVLESSFNENTLVKIKDTFVVGMDGPVTYTNRVEDYLVLDSTVVEVDPEASTIKFLGQKPSDILLDTVFKIEDKYIYKVLDIGQTSEFFILKFTPTLNPAIRDENYSGYIKYTREALPLDEWRDLGSNINKRRLEVDTDYSITTGEIVLAEGIRGLDRFSLNYMGQDSLVDSIGESITASCRYYASIPVGYKVDVSLDYINIDQFYLQKLTERQFSEIVVIPQIDQIQEQKGSGGGVGVDTSPSSPDTPPYEGGVSDDNYKLVDERIKKQLYLRFFDWYKQRLRGFSSELQLSVGFKFAHSNAVGKVGSSYTLNDSVVEDQDYTLTTQDDIDQIENQFSQFFPVGYNRTAPDYYDRFSNEYKESGEVYCCNITYIGNDNTPVTVGIIKASKPYWARKSDIDFVCIKDDYIKDDYIEDTLVGEYTQPIPLKDRTFTSDEYTFLKRINVGDSVRLDASKTYYNVNSIVSPKDKEYEYIKITGGFKVKGITDYDLKSLQSSHGSAFKDKYGVDLTFDTLVDSFSATGYYVWIKRQQSESFPMFDDSHSLVASSVGDKIPGQVIDTRRINKPSNFFISLFTGEPVKNFEIEVKKDPESDWKSLGSIDLSKLSNKEERNVDDVLDALRFDFTVKYEIPTLTDPIIFYDIKEDPKKGFFRYFNLSFDKNYDKDESTGYYDSIRIRAKDRDWWFRVKNGSSNNTVEDYGYTEYLEYKNFYDPECLYRKLLLEKQGWQTEEMILKDLYDHGDKLARAFEQGRLNKVFSIFQNLLSKPIGGTENGISDIMYSRILASLPELRFLISDNGPLMRVLKPDGVNYEDDATPAIKKSFEQTLEAYNIYKGFYERSLLYYNINNTNNVTWRKDYVRWATSLEEGLIYQEDAKKMYTENVGVLDVGLYKLDAISITFLSPITSSTVSVYSDLKGKLIKIDFIVSGQSITYTTPLYDIKIYGGVETVVYKKLDSVVSDINSYRYNGAAIFNATNSFGNFENKVTKDMLEGTFTGSSSTGLILQVTNVADHLEADSRILFLNKNIEDRIYTQDGREKSTLELSYLGNFYTMKPDTPVIRITADTEYQAGSVVRIIQNPQYYVHFDENLKKILVLKGGYLEATERSDLRNEIGQYTPILVAFSLYNDALEEYITVKDLVDDINNYEILGEKLFKSESIYDESLSTSSFYVNEDFVKAKYERSESAYIIDLYAHLDTTFDNTDEDLNQGRYKVFVDGDTHRKMEVIFGAIIQDGRYIVEDNDGISTSFVFDMQKDNDEFYTISEFSEIINSFVYKQDNLFNMEVVYQEDPLGDLSTRYMVADNEYYPLPANNPEILYSDIYLDTSNFDSDNKRDTTNVQNAYFSFPMYTANGNTNKTAIEGIPVSGSWDSSTGDPVVLLNCIDDAAWEITYTGYSTAGDSKYFDPPPAILEDIDKNGYITAEQQAQLQSLLYLDKPEITILKELVLRKERTDKVPLELRINLRKEATINDLVSAINAARFDAEGTQTPLGERQIWEASLIGDPEVQGEYKSYEIFSEYTPVIRSYEVVGENGSSTFKSDQFIGWSLISTDLKKDDPFTIVMDSKRYSYGPNYSFNMDDPKTAQEKTLTAIPQGYRTDITPFDVFCWDEKDTNGDRYVQVKDNWIYFKSANVFYTSAADYGQPDKTLGYGIPLAGSGHNQAPEGEYLLSLVERINGNSLLNKYFYANLIFTRTSPNKAGQFEYNYLPNYKQTIEDKSEIVDFNLADANVMAIRPGRDYRFTSSNYSTDSGTKSITITCDYEYDYQYTFGYNFLSPANTTIQQLVDGINSGVAPEFSLSVFQAQVVGSYGTTLSTELLSVTPETAISDSYIDLDITGNNTAMRLKVRSLTGAVYEISDATYEISADRKSLTLKCKIVYQSTYTLNSFSYSSMSIGSLVNYIGSITDLADPVFPPLFRSNLVNSFYADRPASYLQDSSGSFSGGAFISSYLGYLVGLRLLNMSNETSVTVDTDNIVLNSNNLTIAQTSNKNLYSWIDDTLLGNYKTGFLGSNVLPMKVGGVYYGTLASVVEKVLPYNTPWKVYFGVLGEMKFIQVSDYNLHTQLNWIKNRLAQPWKNEFGIVVPDYYTPQNYSEDNPYGLDFDNFLNFIRNVRYNQIKESIENEAIIQNKYFWLYMKFHREFGCDQRVKALQDQIEKNQQDTEIIGDVE